ncbi:MAG: trigger factor, partial [Verrucomicrobiae bacterium]|nr:trigger factor [Verrucomicrobiae bacterium]
MNVTVENIGPCKRLLRVELDGEAVKQAFAEATRHYLRNVRLPGFRPGKAPQHLVVRQFADGIKDEAKRRLLNDSYPKALEENKLRPIIKPEVEEGELAEGQPFSYTVTVEIEPEFTLPEYKGVPVRLEEARVTDADLERAFEVLREQKASYEDVDRAVSSGDFVVVKYTGSCEGKPITDFNPTARGLTKQENYWLEVRTDHFIPGFTDQLLGAARGDHRTVQVKFPEDFVIKEVAGKDGTYEVDLLEIKEKKLPPLDDELAKAYKAEDLTRLREGVTKDLERELEEKRRRTIREQLLNSLLSRAPMELPETLVQHETRNVVYDIVKSNAERGVPKEAMDQQQDQIYALASNSAQERLKVRFMFERIAEAEKIGVTQQELSQRVLQLAAAYQI